MNVVPDSLGLAEERIPPDEAATIAEFITFLKEASRRRHPTGPVRRFNQGRHTACVTAEFEVRDGLAAEHRVGLFAQPRTYRAFIRFANASSASDRERDVRGMAVRVADVAGENLTAGSTSLDFILNSHPVMVAQDTKEFLALLKAMEAGGLRRILYFAQHLGAGRIGLASRSHPTSHLDISYWSTTPYLFGRGRAVKYIARPCSDRKSALPSPLTDGYLRDAMRAHLGQSDACFDFMVQFQVDPERMPIEDAMVEWREEESPYVPVARIRIPRQSIDDRDRMSQCERVAFNPWHCLAEHRPLGSMNRARRDIYAALSAFRTDG
jgi:hypothetical protein